MMHGTFEFLKSHLPNGLREASWRLRWMPRQEALRLLSTVRTGDIMPVLRAFHGDYDGDQLPLGRMRVALRGHRRAIRLRNGTSDFAVFRQVFLQGQYAGLPIRAPRVILDAGANIGLTSLYLLHRYPGVRVIAIEPDPDNLVVAEENLAPHRNRCTLIHGALWSHRTRLSIHRTGGYWATQVGPDLGSDSIAVEGYSLTDIMRENRLDFIDLLKVDIEGAEEVVFSTEEHTILKHVGCCAIELHNDACVKAFEKAASWHNLEHRRQGELTVVWKRRLRC